MIQSFYSRPVFLFLLCCLALSSCALFKAKPEALNKNIDQWLTENEYDEIQYAFNKISSNTISDKSNNDNTTNKYQFILDRKPEIENKKNQFIENASETAQKHKQSKNWQLALDTYDNALTKINHEPRLSLERQGLLSERDKQINSLQKDMLMQRASALISYKKIYEKLFQLIPDDYGAQLDITDYEKDRLHVAHQLKLCGDQAKNNEQYLLASDCYSLSNKLEPTEQKQQWVTQINKQLIKKSTLKSNTKSLAAYHAAYNKQEYNLARTHLTTMLALNPSHKKSKMLLDSLNSEIKTMTENRINRGKELYSKKMIDEALAVWQQAILLDPKNTEVIQLINRAEKVSKKIQSLEQSQ